MRRLRAPHSAVGSRAHLFVARTAHEPPRRDLGPDTQYVLDGLESQTGALGYIS